MSDNDDVLIPTTHDVSRSIVKKNRSIPEVETQIRACAGPIKEMMLRGGSAVEIPTVLKEETIETLENMFYLSGWKLYAEVYYARQQTYLSWTEIR